LVRLQNPGIARTAVARAIASARVEHVVIRARREVIVDRHVVGHPSRVERSRIAWGSPCT
jgi:hypothetical protein